MVHFSSLCCVISVKQCVGAGTLVNWQPLVCCSFHVIMSVYVIAGPGSVKSNQTEVQFRVKSK